MLTLQEAASMLSINPRTYWNRMRKGLLPGVQIAGPKGVWRVRRDDLAAVMRGEWTPKAAGVGPTAEVVPHVA